MTTPTHQPQDVAPAMSGGQVVGQVAMRGRLGEGDEPRLKSLRPAVGDHLVGVHTTNRIVIRHDVGATDAGSSQLLCVSSLPLAVPGAFRIRRRWQVTSPSRIDILLALHYQHPAATNEVWQAIEHGHPLTQAPSPSPAERAVPVEELLVRRAELLKQHRAVKRPIDVGGLCSTCALPLTPLPCGCTVTRWPHLHQRDHTYSIGQPPRCLTKGSAEVLLDDPDHISAAAADIAEEHLLLEVYAARRRPVWLMSESPAVRHEFMRSSRGIHPHAKTERDDVLNGMYGLQGWHVPVPCVRAHRPPPSMALRTCCA